MLLGPSVLDAGHHPAIEIRSVAVTGPTGRPARHGAGPGARCRHANGPCRWPCSAKTPDRLGPAARFDVLPDRLRVWNHFLRPAVPCRVANRMQIPVPDRCPSTSGRGREPHADGSVIDPGSSRPDVAIMRGRTSTDLCPVTDATTAYAPKRNWFTRFLDTVEWLGNLLPHPVTLFALLASNGGSCPACSAGSDVASRTLARRACAAVQRRHDPRGQPDERRGPAHAFSDNLVSELRQPVSRRWGWCWWMLGVGVAEKSACCRRWCAASC